MQRDTRSSKWLLIACILMLAASVSHGYMRKGKEKTLTALTRESDSVIVGSCKGKKVDWVGKSLETQYTIEVQEQLKGKLYKTGQQVVITLPGGELTTPPLTQYVEMVPRMFVGEDVALFLKKDPPQVPAFIRAKINPKSNLHTGPFIVGWYEGKFSVVTDKRDGKRKVTRINLDRFAMTQQEAVLERVVKAVANGSGPIANVPVVELGGGLVTTPEGKAVLDKVTQATGPVAPIPAPKVTPLPEGTRAIPVQDFDEFKAQIKTLAE